jgi:CHASE2 domain-containing sensor protein
MTTEVQQRQWVTHFGTGFAIVILAALLSHTVRNTSFITRMEMLNLDSWVAFQLPPESSEIVIVAITDQEYQQKENFNSTSPLSARRVTDVICAIAKSGPKLIGVDVDTSGWSAIDRENVYQSCPVRKLNARGPGVPIVWAIGGYEDEDKNQNRVVHLDSIQGIAPDDCFAVVADIEDVDGVVRSYDSAVLSDNQMWPSFGPVIADTQKGDEPACQVRRVGPDRKITRARINFRGGKKAFYHLNISTVLMAADTEAWQSSNPLKHNIVLFGGSYRAARDSYMTPAGQLDGVDVLSHAVLSELPGGQIRDVPPSLFLTFDILMGFGIVTLTYFNKNPWLLLLVLLAIPVLSFAASLVLYNSFSYFASFVPVLVGVFFHELLAHLVEHHRLKRDLQELSKRLAAAG